MDLTTIIDDARDLLGQDLAASSPADPANVIALFREAFFEIRRIQKATYVRTVVEKHTLSHRELGALLGYEGSGAIDAARKGRIRDDRFALLRATIAKQVCDGPRWPTPSEFASLALIRTVADLGERAGMGGESFGPEEYEVLRRVLQTDWLFTVARESPAIIQANLDALLEEVRAQTGTSRIQTSSDLETVLSRWGRLYLFCKRSIPGLCGKGGSA
jgi:hypothetical protein